MNLKKIKFFHIKTKPLKSLNLFRKKIKVM